MEGQPLGTPTSEKKLVQGRLNFQVLNKTKPSTTDAPKKPCCPSNKVEVINTEEIDDECIIVGDNNKDNELFKKVDTVKEGVNKENQNECPREPARKKLCTSNSGSDSRLSSRINSCENVTMLELNDDIATKGSIDEAPKSEGEPPVKKRKLDDIDTSPDIKTSACKRKLESVETSPDNIVSPNKLVETEHKIDLVVVDSENETQCEKQTSSDMDTSHNESTDQQSASGKKVSGISRKKTPKQLEKEAESARKKEEKNRLREERETQKRVEEELKRKKREEKELERKKNKEERELLKKKELEEKEEQKRKIKEEKDRKKQQEINMRNEEKLRREEEKKRREEELQRRKEEEAMLKNKYAKEAQAFTSFFTKVGTSKKSEPPPEETVSFKPFAVKNGMRLAPLNRNPLDKSRRNALEEKMSSQSVFETYITQLRCGDIEPGHSASTWPSEERYQDADISTVDDLDLPSAAVCTPKPKLARPKLLQFSENRRPPYWGTWRAKCQQVGPRKPFGLYKTFDYEVDSDDEWEEEEPGESLHGSEDEKEIEEEDDYEVDNDFFVPHGYLSEDEDQDEEAAFSPEKMKAKLKLLGEEFDKERNEKTKQLRPIVLGCIWFSDDNLDTTVNSKVKALLQSKAAFFWQDELPISIEPVCNTGEDLDAESAEVDSPSRSITTKKGSFPAEGVPILLKITYGALVKRKTVATEFLRHWVRENPNAQVPSLAAVSRKVKELANWQECPEEPLLGRFCWYVPRDVLEQQGCGQLSLPNTWPFPVGRTSDVQDDTQRITKFTKVLSEEERRQLLVAEPPEVTVIEEKKPSVALITKFTKVLTEEERKLQLKPSALPSNPVALRQSTPSPTIMKAFEKLSQFRALPSEKKRVSLLMSTPLSQTVVQPLTKPTTPSDASETVKMGAPIVMSTPLSGTTAQPQTKCVPAAETTEVIKKRAPILVSTPLAQPTVQPHTKAAPADETTEVVKKRAPILVSTPLSQATLQPQTKAAPAAKTTDAVKKRASILVSTPLSQTTVHPETKSAPGTDR